MAREARSTAPRSGLGTRLFNFIISRGRFIGECAFSTGGGGGGGGGCNLTPD